MKFVRSKGRTIYRSTLFSKLIILMTPYRKDQFILKLPASVACLALKTKPSAARASLKHQQYLFKEIHQFVAPHCQDTVAPQPNDIPGDSGSDSGSCKHPDEPAVPAKVAKTAGRRGAAQRGTGRGQGGQRGGQ
ncbi:hypothetical protein PoB_002358400 [Plakobranchus ocellatus]|uniref:Uncharacterized protein n=1 Tax=Plakobranchus ocellatus TaxID=259542 RepID=A0AAV3ZP31_9GAST|nr:hypothetical protein PoB_002358400 [Plakobranchus ocellatus]